MSNTTVATIPAGWKELGFFTKDGVNITTSNSTEGVVTLDNSHFNRNILSSWTSTNKGQIDDVIGATKITILQPNGPLVLYSFAHQV